MRRKVKRELREGLSGVCAFFLGRNNPNRIGRKDKPLVFFLDGESIGGLATYKRMSPGSSTIGIKAKFESDVYVNNTYFFILWKTGGIQLSERGHILPLSFVKENKIIMGILKAVKQIEEVS